VTQLRWGSSQLGKANVDLRMHGGGEGAVEFGFCSVVVSKTQDLVDSRKQFPGALG